jgi:secreted trypsin-like serine protease
MKRRWIVLACVLVGALLTAVSAQAITFGTPDGDGHPNVGVMVVEAPNGSRYLWCSGTLIAPDVFLTAAHCTNYLSDNGFAPHNTWVSFDPVAGDNSTFYRGTYYVNDRFGSGIGKASDVAVVVLDAEIQEITPARLPQAGLLDQLKQDGQFKNARFVAVGYGMLREDKTGGPRSLQDNNERRFVEQAFLALTPGWIHLSMNPSTGNGGTCYGDSGGPHFWGDSDVVVAVTSWGDYPCRALDVDSRLDTEPARAYLKDFVTLP